ncbi:hypothetical protein JQC91_08015 [Jannaschia sp. Os4]|uniref:hypothetical protein n=1 Tax=Jannaschia sp. Os4 TaxID=2807617 RepID=UPI00193A0DE5|nr:hypothetical protein [Jannaschia sp. Os4]MBM2576249.1 hypothetical protein [Jannaschia sp. Os4]
MSDDSWDAETLRLGTLYTWAQLEAEGPLPDRAAVDFEFVGTDEAQPMPFTMWLRMRGLTAEGDATALRATTEEMDLSAEAIADLEGELAEGAKGYGFAPDGWGFAG